jgi:hypothetical protein
MSQTRRKLLVGWQLSGYETEAEVGTHLNGD